MGTLFASPEEYLVVEGQKPKDMFFIISGDCIVILRDIKSNIEIT